MIGQIVIEKPVENVWSCSEDRRFRKIQINKYKKNKEYRVVVKYTTEQSN